MLPWRPLQEFLCFSRWRFQLSECSSFAYFRCCCFNFCVSIFSLFVLSLFAVIRCCLNFVFVFVGLVLDGQIREKSEDRVNLLVVFI